MDPEKGPLVQNEDKKSQNQSPIQKSLEEPLIANTFMNSQDIQISNNKINDNNNIPVSANKYSNENNYELDKISEKQSQQTSEANFPPVTKKIQNSMSQKIENQNNQQTFNSPLGVPLASLHMRSQFILNNQNIPRQDRIQSHQQGLDIVSQTIKNRQEFYLNSQVLRFDRNNQKKALETSVIIPYEKSQYLTSEYIQTYQENYEWPASLEKALDHERATSTGREKTKINARGYEVIDYKACKCCLNNINKEPINWFKGHVNKDLPYQAGTAIPLYFNLIIFFTVVMLIVFLTNGVYIIYQTYNICSYKVLKYNYCTNWGFLQFASKEYIRWILAQTKGDEGELNLMVWLNFSAYVILQISQIFMDIYIDKWQKQMGKPKSQQCSRSLLFTHIPKSKLVEEDGQNIYKKLQEENDIKKYLLKYIRNKAKEHNLQDTYQVVDMTVIYDYSKYDDFFNKRTNVYYKLKPILNNQELNKEIDIIEMKAYMYFWNQYLQLARADFEGKVIVTFANSQQAFDVKNKIIDYSFAKSSWLHIVNFFGQFIMKEKIKNYLNENDFIRTELVNEPFEIIWQNFGIKYYDKRKEYVWTWIFFMISVLVLVLLLYLAETYINGTALTYLFLLLIVIHTVVTTVIAAQRKGKTHSSNTYFIVSRLTPFQMLIIVVLPFIYYIKNYTYQLDPQKERKEDLQKSIIQQSQYVCDSSENTNNNQSHKKITKFSDPEDKHNYDINISSNQKLYSQNIEAQSEGQHVDVHINEENINFPCFSDKKPSSRLTVAYEKEKAYSNHYNIFKKKYYNPKLEEEIRNVLELKEIAKHQELQLQERIQNNKKLMQAGVQIKEESFQQNESGVKCFTLEEEDLVEKQ
ncbi:hypothetical protein PPERSA_03182 [Pseudocohnilembus persalinus]|uniref:Transmembrane protein n=1 Tax=Pseudocohnilembus persalinus TaxID=266149 RepID=A0A0V0QE20_PSEPJ|nr:hypothetical protein PPERSA_03182 [Pseudocohnilembus persalinus]|eukprot:KRX00449.1 hypothetical protein PPERSA_03182 [Pseudocohnilembus persalinus]